MVFDSFTDNSSLSWQLTGGGRTIGGNFRASDSFERSTLPSALLPPGTYEILVKGDVAGTGPFAFRLLDLAASATAIAGNGSETAGVLDPGKETDVFAFTAAAGEKFAFDDILSPGFAGMRIIDPFGRDVTSAIGFDDRTFTTELAGTYYLLVEGRPWDTTATLNYRFALHRPVDPAVQAIALGQTVTATIARPTESNTYSFTVTERTLFYVDSFTPDFNLNWQLSGAQGAIASNNFYSTDSLETPSHPVITLAPGIYTYTVGGNGFTTGSAQFRLLDLQDAPTLALRQPVNGVLDPARETATYAFTAQAGQRFFLDALVASGFESLRVIGPDGSAVFVSNVISDREFTVPSAGTYYVLIEGRVWDTAATRPYSFTLFDAQSGTRALPLNGGIATPVLRPGKIGNALSLTSHEQIQVNDPALDLRNQVTVEFWINPDRQPDAWSPIVYKGTDGQERTYSVWFNNNGYIHISSERGGSNDALETAAGSVPFGKWTHVAAVIDRVTGTMAIYLDGVLANSRAVSTSPASGSPDTPLFISGTDEYNGAYRKFEGGLDELRIWNDARTQGEIQAEMNAGAPSNSAGLVARFGFDSLSGASTTEAVSGDFIEVRSDLAGLDGAVLGRINNPGDAREYTFNLTERTRLAFDSLHNNANFTITLTGPDGLTLTRNLRNADSFEFGGDPSFVANPGAYKITVRGNGATTGAFAFRVLDLDSAVPMTLGSAVSGQISGSGENIAYKFEVAPGDRLFIDAQLFSTSSDRASFRLYDPLGQLVLDRGQFEDHELAPAIIGGTYTLLIEGRSWHNWPIDYRLAVQKIPATTVVEITPDGPNPDSPRTQPGRTGNALTLRGVDFVEVPDSPAIAPTRNFTLEGWFKLDRFTDTYTPLVYKGNDSPGIVPYAMSVRNNGSLGFEVGDASGNQLIETAAGSFRTGEWVHVAAVSDRDSGRLTLYINGVEAASGAVRTNNSIVNDAPLWIGRHPGVINSVSMFEGAVDSFRLFNTVRTPAEILADMATPSPSGTPGLTYALDFESTALSGGAIVRNLNRNGVTGRLAIPGEQDAYTFTLTEETLISFDSLTDNPAFTWTLEGQGRKIVDDKRFDQSDSQNFSTNSTLRLRPGEYRLTVDGSGDATGFYNFRLLDLANAAPLPLGTLVQGVLETSNSTAAYKFAGLAGEKFVLDAQAVSNLVYWRLVDPNGRDVFNSRGLSDIDGLELPLDGTYTLLIEGRVDQGSNASYAFRLDPYNTQTSAYTLGQRVDAAIGTPGESDRYSFTLTAATRVIFDNFTDDANINWSLSGPGGRIVSSQDLRSSDGIDLVGTNPLLPLEPGEWTMTFDGAGAYTGNYGFRLLDAASAQPIVAGGTYNGVLTQSGRETDLYRFDATQGQRFQLDALESVSGLNRWRLFDPLGRQVFGPDTIEDTGYLTATVAGTYTLVVEGRDSNTANDTYSFRFDVPLQPSGAGESVQDFDSAGLPYVLFNHRGPAAQVVSEGGNDFLRLTDTLATNVTNTAFFSANGVGRQDRVELEFDFRLEQRAGQVGNAHGLGLSLLPVSLYGPAGPSTDEWGQHTRRN